jgi:hypothetical protein
MHKRSPLRLSEKRGSAFRYTVSALWLSLCSFLAYEVVVGLVHGTMFLKLARFGHSHQVSRADSPGWFWFAVVFNSALIGLMTYLSVAEILYTRRHERRVRHHDAA